MATAPLHISIAMALIGIGCSPVLMASYYIFAREFPPARFATLAAVMPVPRDSRFPYMHWAQTESFRSPYSLSGRPITAFSMWMARPPIVYMWPSQA